MISSISLGAFRASREVVKSAVLYGKEGGLVNDDILKDVTCVETTHVLASSVST